MPILQNIFVAIWFAIASFIPMSAPAQGNPMPAFTVYPGFTQIRLSSVIEIGNMPAVLDQGVLGTCFGCAAATIAQKFICDEASGNSLAPLPCKNLPPEKRVSLLGMIAWSDTNSDRVEGAVKYEEPGYPSNHRNLKLYVDRTDFSSGSNALMNSSLSFSLKPESCYPMSVLIDKYGSSTSGGKRFEQVYLEVREKWSKARSGTANDAQNLRMEIPIKLALSVSEPLFLEAMGKKTFGEFFYHLAFGECKSFRARPTPKFHQNEVKITAKAELFPLISSVLASKRPLQLNTVCLRPIAEGRKCESWHTIVISGVRTVCSVGPGSSDCRPELKVHNCWGEKWQRENNDGWVDAAMLIEHVNYGQSYFERGEVSWLSM